MNFLFVIFSFSTMLTSALCFETTHHRHRHSRSHPQEYNFDRLMNRLDAQSPIKGPETTTNPPEKDIFDDFTEPAVRSNPDPGNSLWDVDSGDSSSQSPLDAKRWDEILKGSNLDKEKRREEVEDAEDDADETEDEEEDGFVDQEEQADSYRPWNSRNGESFSNWKWENMGSQKSVDSLFQIYRSGNLRPDAGAKESADKFEVFRHTKLMAKETLCKWPRPKVVRVSDHYGSANKLYVPACTLLHQCGDDTGCCTGSNQRCVPKTTKRVELYFYTTYIKGSHNQHITNGMEKLPFYNHTECECRDRLDEMMPRDGGLNADFRSERNSEHGCKCPSEYTVRRLANGSCRCDCFDKQRDCIKYKRGKEYFNHSDRLCIAMGTCEQPTCDFGVYIRSAGRCPRKHEKFHTWSRHHH